MDKVQAVEQVKLMQAIADGDRQAFEQLYRLTSPHLFCHRVAHVAASPLG